MKTLIAALLLAALPAPNTTTTTVDIIELNFTHDQEFGTPGLVQVLLWRWDKWRNRFVIVGFTKSSGYKLANDGWDKSDPEHKAAYEKELRERFSGLERNFRQYAKIPKEYPGKWVGSKWEPKFRNGYWTLRWEENGAIQIVRAKSYVVTRTQYDREHANRRVVPQLDREAIRPPKEVVVPPKKRPKAIKILGATIPLPPAPGVLR